VVTATYTQKRIRGAECQIEQSRNNHYRGEMEETIVKRYLGKFWVWKKELGRGLEENCKWRRSISSCNPLIIGSLKVVVANSIQQPQKHGSTMHHDNNRRIEAERV
jgi:hypothetical protein